MHIALSLVIRGMLGRSAPGSTYIEGGCIYTTAFALDERSTVRRDIDRVARISHEELFSSRHVTSLTTNDHIITLHGTNLKKIFPLGARTPHRWGRGARVTAFGRGKKNRLCAGVSVSGQFHRHAVKQGGATWLCGPVCAPGMVGPVL